MNEEERKAAEHDYSIKAFDYESNPIGSRDWTLFLKGWQAALEWQKSKLSFSDYDYAKSIAQLLWEKHYKHDAPNWKPLDDCFGVLTQIDNMTVGLSKSPPTAQINEQMREALMHAQRVLNHNNLALECAPINEAIKQAALAAATPK